MAARGGLGGWRESKHGTPSRAAALSAARAGFLGAEERDEASGSGSAVRVTSGAGVAPDACQEAARGDGDDCSDVRGLT